MTTADAHGIVGWAASGDSTLNITNNVTTGQASATTHNHGLEAGTLASGKASVHYDNGTVKVVGSTTGGSGSEGGASQ